MSKPDDAKAPQSDALLTKLLESRNIIISEEIDDGTAHRVIAQLLLLEATDAAKDIRVFINSSGGIADAGFAIFDMIRFVKPPVKTIAAGLCASAASIILLGAKKESRFGLPHCRILIHQPATALQGSAVDIHISAQEILKLRDKANQLIAAETGQTVQKVATDTNRDYWMDPEEARRYGLISRTIRSADEI